MQLSWAGAASLGSFLLVLNVVPALNSISDTGLARKRSGEQAVQVDSAGHVQKMADNVKSRDNFSITPTVRDVSVYYLGQKFCDHCHAGKRRGTTKKTKTGVTGIIGDARRERCRQDKFWGGRTATVRLTSSPRRRDTTGQKYRCIHPSLFEGSIDISFDGRSREPKDINWGWNNGAKHGYDTRDEMIVARQQELCWCLYDLLDVCAGDDCLFRNACDCQDFCPEFKKDLGCGAKATLLEESANSSNNQLLKSRSDAGEQASDRSLDESLSGKRCRR